MGAGCKAYDQTEVCPILGLTVIHLSSAMHVFSSIVRFVYFDSAFADLFLRI
jgi:hypothetical protein